jgi:NADH-quinone oxidoreductase subunit L
MAVVGAVTAIFAATIALAQNDVKKVLAYSTISQLGFMMAALGTGAYIAAAFHLITHAFFKALLFMASGAVIHGMEHGEHHVHEHAHGHHGHDEHHEPHHAAIGDEAGEHGAHGTHPESAEEHPHGAPHTQDAHAHGSASAGWRPLVEPVDPPKHFDPQDMMNMGGLRKTMPVTFWTFLIGGFSLAGFPLLTAGFWSKDEILAETYAGMMNGYGPHALVFVLLATAAFLTAFYTMRQLGLTFWGEPRTEEAKHASLGQGIVSLTMTAPLILLAIFAITAGFVGVPPDFPIFGAIFSPQHNPFHHFVIETLPHHDAAYPLVPEFHVEAPPFNVIPVAVSFIVALGGLYLGYLMYWRKPLQAGEPDPLVKILGETVHTTLKNKYYIDEIYRRVFIVPSQWFSQVVAYEFIDKGLIDGFLHLIARVFTWIGDFLKVLNNWLIDGVGDGIPYLIADFGRWFRQVQTGRVQQYMLFVAIAAILIGIIFAVSTGILQAAG